MFILIDLPLYRSSSVTSFLMIESSPRVRRRPPGPPKSNPKWKPPPNSSESRSAGSMSGPPRPPPEMPSMPYESYRWRVSVELRIS